MPIDNPYEPPSAEDPALVPDLSASERNWNNYSPEYNTAFKSSLWIQAVLAVISALLLDFGQLHRAFWVAFLCQWAMVWLMLFRRPLRPTRVDLLLVRYGIFLFLLIVAGTGLWFVRLLGY